LVFRAVLALSLAARDECPARSGVGLLRHIFCLRASNAEVGEHMRIHYLELPHFEAMVPIGLYPGGGPGKQISVAKSDGGYAGACKFNADDLLSYFGA
jgi:hypothetical protein